MSRRPSKAHRSSQHFSKGCPPIGTMMRLTYQMGRRRQLDALMERGFTDLNPSLLNVFAYPPPDGVRPSELAERTHMTKQAMNYLLGQLEALGYVERRSENGSDSRLVFLTPRGWKVFEIQGATMQTVEAEWAEVLGEKRFDLFRAALRQLSSHASNDVRGPRKSRRVKE